MNSWENQALQYYYPDHAGQQAEPSATAMALRQRSDATDPIIYPGLYSRSGFDVMNILIRVASRPNPKVQLGPVDCSCALLMCDLTQHDTPIIYASDPFFELTGYARSEVLGRNCRFLQSTDGKIKANSTRSKHVDKEAIKRMRKAIDRNEEIQLEIANFKKGGKKFVNMLTIVPVRWDGDTFRYSVGFLSEV